MIKATDNGKNGSIVELSGSFLDVMAEASAILGAIIKNLSLCGGSKDNMAAAFAALIMTGIDSGNENGAGFDLDKLIEFLCARATAAHKWQWKAVPSDGKGPVSYKFVIDGKEGEM